MAHLLLILQHQLSAQGIYVEHVIILVLFAHH